MSRSRNKDGGWGYYPGKASRIEPTAWGLVASAAAAGSPVDSSLLERWPRANGWLVDVPGTPPNFAYQALAAVVLQSTPHGLAAATALATGLLQVRGARFDQSPVIRQDNSLQAWPWIADTFSWVEPTSLCLLLIKRLRDALPADAARERIQIGERMLIDRACSVGGWNYGGSNVYGQELYPYVPTTAWGLLALQDRRSDPVVGRALSRLKADALTEQSALSMGMAAIAFRRHGESVEAIESALGQEAERGLESGSILNLGIATYVLASKADDGTFAL